MEHVDIDGMRIAYIRAGAGPPLVMLHGAPCDSRTWQWMLPDLSRDHTVVAWDAPGIRGVVEHRRQLASATVRRRPRRLHRCARPRAAAPRGPLVRDDGRPLAVRSATRRCRRVSCSSVATRAGRARCRLTRWHDGWRCSSAWPTSVTRSTRSPTRACSPTSYPADRDTALATMMRENIRPATIRAAGHIGAETDLRPMLPTVDVPTLILHGARRCSLAAVERRGAPCRDFRHRSSSCCRSSAMPAWSRTPRHAQPRSADS